MLLMWICAGHAEVSQPVPDRPTLSRLVWTTMLTLDNANRTGNYGVFYALCAPEFQALTSVNELASQFESLRNQRVDVGKTVLLAPTFILEPHYTDTGLLRLRGGFEFRPDAIRFDLLFSRDREGWRIMAISVAEMSI